MSENNPLPNPEGELIPIILAVDPGRSKCGYALVRPVPQDATGSALQLLHKGIVATGDLPALCARFAADHPAMTTIMGGGTSSASARGALEALGIRVEMVDERWTTHRARERYFLENPPRSWKRLLPRGLLTPPGPVDDYAALLLAEDWAAGRSLRTSPPPGELAGPKGPGNG